MNSCQRARLWRTGLLLLALCGGLAVASAEPPDGPNLQPGQTPRSEDPLPKPRPDGERPVPRKRLDDLKRPAGQRDPDIEATLPQRPGSILPGEMNAVDLCCALRLAGANNPDFLLARQRVARAYALRFLAMTFVLPNLNGGFNYDNHNGVLQQSSGNILDVNRQALYVGAGAGAIAAGTVGIPGVQYILNFSEGIFNFMAIRYNVRAREAENIAVRNQVFLRVCRAYMDLVRAESWRSIAITNQQQAYDIAYLTAAGLREGTGNRADADRAASELSFRNQQILRAEEAMLVASARLAALLNIPPSVQMHPIDGWLIPTEIVPNTLPLQELIFIATQQRPELAARRNEILEAVMRMRNQIFLPLSPTVLAGYSAGTFGGGSNLVNYPGGFQGFKQSFFGNFAPRQDIDVVMFWTARNMGLGNLGQFRVARAEREIAKLEFIRELNRVRDDVAVAYARMHANYAQIDIARRAMEAGLRSFTEDRRRITSTTRNALPIELLNSFRLLAQGRMDYLNAVVDYDTAQFAMYVALGQPPTCNFAHEIPHDAGISPPQPAPPLPGCGPGGCGPGSPPVGVPAGAPTSAPANLSAASVADKR